MATTTAATDPGVNAAIRLLEALLGGAPLTSTGFRLWDGTRWPDAQQRAVTLVLNHPGAPRAMFGPGGEITLAEAFLRGDFDVEGDIEAAMELVESLARHRGGWLGALRAYYRMAQLPEPPGPPAGARLFTQPRRARHSLSRDREAVSFHYDLSNDFYQLWLDRRMVYSCAYFEDAAADLDAAQEAKLRHLCRKLRLRPGQRLLDIGCGWGGLAIYAAEHFGVRVIGITLSERQEALAVARAAASPAAQAVTILRKDYRELKVSEPFDAIVSVGMAEHVGVDRLPHYFASAAGLLRPGGVFLNHAIGESVRPRARTGRSFIDEYVFPDSDVPPLPPVLQAAEDAGLEVRDVENLREHYALTLRHWVRRLEAAHDAAAARVGEATYRVWRLYLAGSAHGFARGHLAIYQTLLSKPDAAGCADLPLTRSDWYMRANAET